MKHTQVRIVNESGDVKFVPESITTERWFINSQWKVQDLNVKDRDSSNTPVNKRGRKPNSEKHGA